MNTCQKKEKKYIYIYTCYHYLYYLCAFSRYMMDTVWMLSYFQIWQISEEWLCRGSAPCDTQASDPQIQELASFNYRLLSRAFMSSKTSGTHGAFYLLCCLL